MSNINLLSKKNKGYLLAVSATIIWSGNFILARGLSGNIPPVNLAFWRWLVAVVIMFPFVIKNLGAQWLYIKKNIIYLSITSLTGITIFNTFLYIAGKTSPAINLSLIAITSPIFIVIFSGIFSDTKITFKNIAGISITVTGILLLITGGELKMLTKLFLLTGICG